MFTLLPTGLKYLNTYLQSTPLLGFCIMYQSHTLFCNLWLMFWSLIYHGIFNLLSFHYQDLAGPHSSGCLSLSSKPLPYRQTSCSGLFLSTPFPAFGFFIMYQSHTLLCNLWLMLWSLIYHGAFKLLSFHYQDLPGPHSSG
jgi:hypothetical protein